jgi:hypothetical protein
MTQEYRLEKQQPPSTISFHSMNTEWVMRITADRRIEVADGVDVTEAARLVLDALQSMLDVGLEKSVLAEREACAKVADGWPDYDVQGLAEAIRARGQA